MKKYQTQGISPDEVIYFESDAEDVTYAYMVQIGGEVIAKPAPDAEKARSRMKAALRRLDAKGTPAAGWIREAVEVA